MSNSRLEPDSAVPLVDGPLQNPDPAKTSSSLSRIGKAKLSLSRTLSRKNLMALTGLFLCLFLVIHLLGNLQLLLPEHEARWQFNFYSKLLSENIFIHVISYLLFGAIAAECSLCSDH